MNDEYWIHGRFTVFAKRKEVSLHAKQIEHEKDRDLPWQPSSACFGAFEVRKDEMMLSYSSLTTTERVRSKEAYLHEDKSKGIGRDAKEERDAEVPPAENMLAEIQGSEILGAYEVKEEGGCKQNVHL